MKKILAFTVLGVAFALIPAFKAEAFDIGKLIDPACFFACDNNPKVVNTTTTVTTTNSNNVNSNVNSPNGVITGNTPNYTTYTPPVYDNPLGASCYPTSSIVNIGSTVVWRVSAFGGNGSYTYSWTGTNISGSGSSVTALYSSPGTKTASVVVTSNGKTFTANCGSVVIYDTTPPPPTYSYDYNYNYNYDSNYNNTSPIGVSCYPTVSNVNIGDTVIWRAAAYGGNGNYNINWSGTNGLSGSGPNISINYNNPGTKTASVTVNSGNQTITRSCSSVVVNDYNYNNNYNQNYNYNNNNNYNNYNSNCLSNNGYTLYNNCYDNNSYYNNNYNNYGSQLIVSCTANTTFAPVPV